MDQIKNLYQKTKQSLLFTHKNNPDSGIELLKQVQSRIKYLKDQHPQLHKELISLQVISLNNLACAYNKKAKYRAALYHLHIARQLEGEIFGDVGDGGGDPEALHQVATTHSNMCAVLSQMGDHQKAYKEIYRAIQLLAKSEQTNKSDALAVFTFNCAVELEYLNKLNEAQKMAEKGYTLSVTTKKEMEQKFVQLLANLEEKIKKREKKVAKMMIESMKMRNKSVNDDKSLARRGNSLNLITQYASGHQNLQNSNVSKQLSAYKTRMPKIANRTIRPSQYPMVRLPSFPQNNNTKLGFALGLEQRKKVISLYSPQKRQKRIPRNHQLSLKRKQETLGRIIAQQAII